MPYWSGLAQGFQERREAEYKKNYERELQNRQMSDRVFSYLLNSRDPEMQQMALQGLMQPIGKKKGFRGFLNEIDPSAQPFLTSVVSRMNEMVPDEGFPNAPPPPPSGAAAMSPNQPVRPGSEPIEGTPLPFEEPVQSREIRPEEPTPGQPGALQESAQVTAPAIIDQTTPMAGPIGPGAPPVTALPAGEGMAGPPPGPSKFKRRGTGVPNAEEIAEMNAQAVLSGRINAARSALLQAGATQEEIESTIMGLAGAPRAQRYPAQVTQWGVKLPNSTIVQPVIFDPDKRAYVLSGGEAIPPGAQMVRMSGGGGGGALSTRIPDSAQGRQYLLEQGVDPSEIASGSPSGYWKMVTRADGTVGVQADMYPTQPAFSGTTVITDPENPEVSVRAGVQRGGEGTTILGDEPQPVKSDTQLAAEALLKAVDGEVDLSLKSTLGRVRGISPQARDAIVARLAQTANPPLPYRTYQQLLQATQASTPVAARTRAEGGSMAEKVRADALAERTRQQQQRQQQQPQARPTGPPPARNPANTPAARPPQGAARPPENRPRLAGEMGRK